MIFSLVLCIFCRFSITIIMWDSTVVPLKIADLSVQTAHKHTYTHVCISFAFSFYSLFCPSIGSPPCVCVCVSTFAKKRKIFNYNYAMQLSWKKEFAWKKDSLRFGSVRDLIAIVDCLKQTQYPHSWCMSSKR